jgi:hypothetical protein
METIEVERHNLPTDTTEKRSFDEIAKGFADGTASREQVLKGLVGALFGGGLLALVPGVAGAKAHQSSGSSAGVGGGGGRRQRHRGGDGKRRTHHRGEGGRRRKHRSGEGSGGGGGGGDVCPPTCPRGTLTVMPSAQGECRCVPVSPGLRDPEFACGGRVNANGDACCFCLFNAEGEGFCAVNTDCDIISSSFVTTCTSSGECAVGWKCVLDNPILVEIRPTEGFCWPECHATDGVDPVF